MQVSSKLRRDELMSLRRESEREIGETPLSNELVKMFVLTCVSSIDYNFFHFVCSLVALALVVSLSLFSDWHGEREREFVV